MVEDFLCGDQFAGAVSPAVKVMAGHVLYSSWSPGLVIDPVHDPYG